ncbi:carboxymuconolactone decarboxylase family protein [Alteromonas pelagimontana]|uniref:Carboxymuconolactone decarboxylase family protein n=2 Tax=Alteromonas pelagimontana TaxID=1858656 RepID=A0A6M4MJI2_9ALTE|nr:carboxymuconolactone decarboxylase family protein [Alteromonas pelagimontana]QJR82825.1 carboxymuconolactone decarboxylase family protein [Alteromonas pelagimontana]
MLTRINQSSLYERCPRLVKNLTALGNVKAGSGIDPSLIHLVKLRVSQINHCCFCQHMHSAEARKDGELQERLDVLPAWQEAPCFSQKERAALAWAEALTLISNSVTDAIYQQTVEALGEEGLIELTTVILAINSWNRVAVSLQFSPDMQSAQA